MRPTVVEPSLSVKLASAGAAACVADMITFPLDTAKVRLQIQGEGTVGNSGGILLRQNGVQLKYRGMLGTMMTMARQEGVRSLYNGLVPGLQRQVCFASIRIGFYDSVKAIYQTALLGEGSTMNVAQGFTIRIMAGITTGCAAVLVAQPTDVVKVRLQAQSVGGVRRYNGCLNAYSKISREEGVRGLKYGSKCCGECSRNCVL